MAMLNQVQMGMREKTFIPLDVPNDDRAKLMYYLKTILELIESNEVNDPAVARLLNYKQYQLTPAETDALVKLSLVLKPDLLLGKVLIIDEAACGDEDHKYIEISKVTNKLMVAGPLIISGQERQVRQVMAIKKEWLAKYYVNPINKFLLKAIMFEGLVSGVEDQLKNQREQEREQKEKEEEMKRRQLQEERMRQERQAAAERLRREREEEERRRRQRELEERRRRMTEMERDRLAEERRREAARKKSSSCVIL